MRILHLMAEISESPGGAERYAAAIADQQTEIGHDVALAARDARLRATGVLDPQSKVELLDFAVPELARRSARHGILRRLFIHVSDCLNTGPRRGVRALIQAWQPDVVHLHNFTGGAGLGILLGVKGVPWVQTIHDFAYLDPRTTLMDRKGQPLSRLGVLRRVRLRIFRGALSGGRLIFPTQRTADLFESFGFGHPLPTHIVPHGLGAGRSVPSDPRTDDKTRFLFIGKLSAHKGVELLLRSWPANNTRVELIVAGSGPFENEVAAFAQRVPSVKYLGWMAPQDLWSSLPDIDCLIFPSLWYENYPLAVQEALARGVPVIATSICSPPSVRHGETGLLVDAEEASLSEAIVRFSTDATLQAALKEGAGNEARLVAALRASHLPTLSEIYSLAIRRSD